MKIRALVVEAKDAPFKVQEIELAEPGRGEALVRIAASGVCHTDAITRAGDLPMPFPCVLGHEGSGTVERVGPGVTTGGAQLGRHEDHRRGRARQPAQHGPRLRRDPHHQLEDQQARRGGREDHRLDGGLRVRLHGRHPRNRDHRADRGDARNARADRRRPRRRVVLSRSPLDAVGQASHRRARRRRAFRSAHPRARRAPPARALPVRSAREVLRARPDRRGARRLEERQGIKPILRMPQ